MKVSGIRDVQVGSQNVNHGRPPVLNNSSSTIFCNIHDFQFFLTVMEKLSLRLGSIQ